ncbi:MAG: hypothetical protein D4S01_10660 [Dehalococcoidia bacterium]|nr:MAG: hypothetical protein D4S01_10660 [Dehalococcoidia bacterium]
MNTKLVTGLRGILCVLVIATLIISVGCQGEGGQLPAPSSSSELSSTLVPNMALDVYVYAKQDSPTMIPAEMVDAPYDVGVESLAVWGVFAEDKFAFGVGLTLTSASDASRLYDEIDLGEEGWKTLDGNTIFFVYGSGTAAESLTTAISNRVFKYYDDSESLEAVASLPSQDTTKLAAIALAKPSEELIGFLTKDTDFEDLGPINTMLELANLKVVAAGLYSPHQIDLAQAAAVMESDGDISNLDIGLLVLVKSGLPGFLVEPAVEKFLSESDFTETNLGELTIYKGLWDSGGGAIPVLVRIEGNCIFAAVAGQESYAETLITSTNK